MLFSNVVYEAFKNTSYDGPIGGPHIHLQYILKYIDTYDENEDFTKNLYWNEFKDIPKQMGLDERGITIYSLVYQNIATLLRNISPDKVGELIDDYMCIDKDIEFHPLEYMSNFNHDEKVIFSALHYLYGVNAN